MAEPFKLPPHPRTNVTNPFEDEQGKNPFSDQETPPSTSGTNPYQTDVASSRPYAPVSDTHSYVPRGRLLASLGFTSLICASLSAVCLFAPIDFLWTELLTFAFGLAAFILGIAAALMGHQDRRAVLAGAMTPDCLGAVNTAIWTGALSILGSLALIGGWILYAMFEA